RHPHRNDFLLAWRRTLAGREHPAARLSGAPGRDAGGWHPRHSRQSRRRPDVRLPQSADPPLMSLTQTTAVAPLANPGSLRLFWRSFSENRGAAIGLGVIVTLVLLAVFADVLARHSPI